MYNLDSYSRELNGVGWFIPPYITMEYLNLITKKIKDANGSYTQNELEAMLTLLYSRKHLASMVLDRYTITPYVKDYVQIISEAVLAHFSCLDHIAVIALMPVIEGAGKALAKSRGITIHKKGGTKEKSPRAIFSELTASCKKHVLEHNIGAVGAVVSMLDSFNEYIDKNLYIKSSKYSHVDKTNRHGILHGSYTDDDYGTPINFYKAIAAVDFLCFISSLEASISWFASPSTQESEKLAKHYIDCLTLSISNPSPGFKLKLDSRTLSAMFEGLEITKK